MEALINLEEGETLKELILLKQEVRELIYEKKVINALQLIADNILKNNKIKTIRDDTNEEMYIYKEGIYLENAKSYIKEFTEDILGTQYTKQKANNVIEKIVAKTYIDSKEFFDQQIKNPYLIPVLNGVLDLKNKELLPFSHKYYFFNKINIPYVEGITPNKIIKFIKQITKCDDDVKVIQELFGFSLVKDYTYEKSFMFYGANGRNGKSKLLSILKHFVGEINVSSIDLHEFNKDNFAISNLRNKLVNIASDISNEDISSTGIFKKLTGRDDVHANRKNLSRVQFVNYAKMIFAANELPQIHTSSDAFWQRWVIIEFPYQFLPKKELDVIPKDKRDNVFLQDPVIVDSLIDDEQMTGLLNWAVEGLSRLIVNKDFSNKETSKSIHSSWLRKSNSVAAFILDAVDGDYDCFIPKKEFKKSYLSYCRSNRLKPLSDKVIKRTIENEIGATTARRTNFIDGLGSESVYVWEGVKFKDVNLEVNSCLDEGEITKSLNSSEEFVE